ncbi:MAG: hypothetical protein Q4C30_04005 [Bacteroidia bacterium]|nr:hypothetical protein [Bacteroidia bacterium]
MILNNIKHLIRLYPLSLALNFIGLTCAFTAFLVISHQVEYELSFDSCHPTSDRIYRADKKDDNSMFRNILPRGFSDDIIASSPFIKAGCSLSPFFGELRLSTVEDQPVGVKKKVNLVSKGFIDVFNINMVEGNSHALDNPNSVIIPESLAKVLFPNRSALGQPLNSDAEYLLRDTKGVVTVTGVYKDFPSNTQLENCIYLALGHMEEGRYGGANYICYLLLDDSSNKLSVEDNFNASYDFERFNGWLTPIELTPLREIYFRNEGDVYKSGSYSQFLLLIAIAILILATGLINFTNFYIALTPIRMKSVNTRMVFGASKLALRCETVGESIVWCLLSYGLALVLFNPICGALSQSGLTPDVFSLSSSSSLLLITMSAALLTGAISGILPGIYSTSIQPALALKGSFALSKSGRLMRKALVYVQVVVSMALLIYVLSIERQSDFISSYPCGFNKDNLAAINIGNVNYNKHHRWLKENLEAIPTIDEVSFASSMIAASDVYNTASYDFGQGSALISQIFCATNFPSMMGVKVTEGSSFTSSSHGLYLLTENMKAIGAEVRKYEDKFEVCGFVNEMNITSMRKGVSNVSLMAVGDDYNWDLGCAYIRLAPNADRAEANKAIRKVLHEMDPIQDYDIIYYDNLSGMVYSAEERLRKDIWIFSMLAIILSLVGIWGQSLMEVRYRRKEISLKRVMGASVSQILAEGVFIYTKMVALCFIIAAPVGYWAAERYLSQFVRHVDISPWTFFISLMAVFVLTMVVVIFHYTSCVRTNPAETLKHE